MSGTILKCFQNLISWGLRYISRSAVLHLQFALQRFFRLNPATNDLLSDFSKILYSTPQVHNRFKVQGSVKRTFSSIKRSGRKFNEDNFKAKARRELFQSSPVKFLMETDRICKLPKKQKLKKEYICKQKQLRI